VSLKNVMKNTLQTKLVAMLVGFSFLSVVIVGGVSMYLSVKSTEQKMIESNNAITVQISSEINRFMEDAKGLTETLAVSPTASSMDAAKIKELLLGAQQKNPQFELLYVMDASGKQTVRTSGDLGDRADRDYFKGAMAGKTYLTDVYVSASTKQPTITISVPIKDANGKTVGVLGSDISLKTVWEVAERTAIGTTGYVDVVDQKGNLIAHPDKERVLKKENVGENSYVKAVLQGETGHQLAPSTMKADSLVTFAPIQGYHWGTLTYLPVAEMNQAYAHILWVIFFIIVLVVILAAVSGYYMARTITKPLQSMVDTCNDLAAGDFRDKHQRVEREDEIGQLGNALNSMSNSLRSLLKQVNESAEQVAASSEELTASAEQSSLAVNQVANSINDVAEGAEKQLRAVDQTSAIVDQMSDGIQQAASSSNQAADHSAQVVDKTKAGNMAVDKAVRQMSAIEETVNNSARVVAALGERSKEIGQIVDTIAGIAGQTNLLALNAAIEAARAGEQGRGFSVVAEEVRKLAEQSQDAAKKIADLIGEIQGVTDHAVVAMEKGTHEVEVGTEVVTAAGQAFVEIETLVAKVSNQVKEISAAMQQMASGSRQIVTSMQIVDGHSKSAVDEAQMVSAATEEQSASMEEIASSSHSLAVLAQDLNTVVSKFRI